METEKPRKTKILYIITKGNWGGAQRYVFDLATGLPADNFKTVVAFGQTGELERRLTEKGVRTISIPRLGRNVNVFADTLVFFDLIKILRRERPDVIHVNSAKIGGLGALAGRIAGVKEIIFTAHGWTFNEDRPSWQKVIIKFLQWVTVILSHAVIVLAEREYKQMASLPFTKKKLQLIYNGVSMPDFLPRDAGTGVRVLTNAELTPNKNLFVGLDAVIKARALGANISYSLMSNGELKEKIEAYLKEKNAGGFIKLLGFVSEGYRHYKNFDIFFLPSKKEGLPYVLLEAGLAELPVIASNVGGIPEIVEHEKSGLLYSPNDTESFAKALHRLATNSAERLRLGQALKEKVLEKFSLDKMLSSTQNLYKIHNQ